MKNNKYFLQSIDFYSKISKSKIYKLTKKLFYVTQLKGPHMDFYNSPYGLNKSSPLDNYNKFQRKIVKGINNLLFCEKRNLFLNEHIVGAITEQIKVILGENDLYWKNYGFSDNDIVNIKKTYQMFLIFLETYKDRTKNKIFRDTKIGRKLLKLSFRSNLGSDITPTELQLFGFNSAKKIIDFLEKSENMHIFKIIEKYKSLGTHVTSATELTSLVMKHILDLHGHIKTKFPENVIIPETHKIKIKEIPNIRAKWSSRGLVSGRYLYLNISKLDSYRKESLLKLCAHEAIPGHIMYKMNTKNTIKEHILKNESLPLDKNKKRALHMMITGTKSTTEGMAVYAESIAKNLYGENIVFYYLTELYHAIRMIVEIGLHYNNVPYIFTEQGAAKILSLYTVMDNQAVFSEICKYYISPGRACAYGFGSINIKNMEAKYLETGKPIGKFYEFIYNSPFPMDILKNCFADL